MAVNPTDLTVAEAELTADPAVPAAPETDGDSVFCRSRSPNATGS
jgi:hypothetical protein